MLTRAEIQALIDAAPDGRIGFMQAGRQLVTIPYGVHDLDGPLVVAKRIDVSFSGGVLRVPNGVTAIEMRTGAWGARARDLCVFGASHNAAAHGAPGVLVESYGAEVCDALVRYCGTGLAIHGTASKQTNANAVQLARVALHDCDTALHLKGGDTNGGCFAGLVINVCRVGILDESFLGNTYVGTMLHTVKEHAYRCTVAANYSTFAGSYVEIDCGSGLPGGFKDTIADVPSTTWLGGGGATLAKIGSRVGLASSRLRFGDDMPGGDRIQVTIPHAAVEAGIDMQRTKLGALVEGVRLRFVSLLKQTGIEAYAPNVPGGPVTGNSLTRPIGWTGAGNPAGPFVARVNAAPNAPTGVEVPKP